MIAVLVSLLACATHQLGGPATSLTTPTIAPSSFYIPEHGDVLVASWVGSRVAFSHRIPGKNVVSVEVLRTETGSRLVAHLRNGTALLLLDREEGDVVIEGRHVATGLGLEPPEAEPLSPPDVPPEAEPLSAPPASAGPEGALDKPQIDGLIKEGLGRIRACYQRELNKDHTLGGYIVLRFTINADGSVRGSTTKATTMNSLAVEGCINRHIESLTFPEPESGGIVIVSYPFVFQPG